MTAKRREKKCEFRGCRGRAAWRIPWGFAAWPVRRAEVERFASAMESKLKRNASKGDSWRNMKPSWLLRRLDTETRELRRATLERPVDAEKVLGEAADVANFAMMVAEVIRARGQEGGKTK